MDNKLMSPVLEELEGEVKKLADQYREVVKKLEDITILKVKYEGALEYLDSKMKDEQKRLKDEQEKQETPVETKPE